MNFVFFILLLLNFSMISAQESKSFEIKFDSALKAEEKITLAFTGDILVHEDLYKSAIASKRNNFSILWEKTNPLIAKADFTYGNLEGPTALGVNNKKKFVGDIGFQYDGSVYSGTNFLFNYHPQIIQDLKTSGFDLVSTANNHTYDRGTIGINKTIDALNKYEMPFVGTRKKGSTEEFFKVTEVKNFKIAWIACTELLNGFIDRNSLTLQCYEQSDKILEMIKKIKSQKLADFTIVTPHWGTEYMHEPNAEQKMFAKLFLEAGADIIIGSHPHVLQPVEKYQTKDGRDTFIAYSLGNFLAYQRDIDRKTSAFIYLELSKNKTTQWISGYSYQPTTRIKTRIIPAADMLDVVNHVEKYLGKFKP